MLIDLTTKERQLPITLMLIHDRRPTQYWAACEYMMGNTVIHMDIDKFDRVQELRAPRNNSHFQSWLTSNPNTVVIINILAYGNDRFELARWLGERMRAMPVRPECNALGINTGRMKRMIVASDGRTFEGQIAAARALGVSQGAISHHLRGHTATVGGVMLQYGSAPFIPPSHQAPPNLTASPPRAPLPNEDGE